MTSETRQSRGPLNSETSPLWDPRVRSVTMGTETGLTPKPTFVPLSSGQPPLWQFWKKSNLSYGNNVDNHLIFIKKCSFFFQLIFASSSQCLLKAYCVLGTQPGQGCKGQRVPPTPYRTEGEGEASLCILRWDANVKYTPLIWIIKLIWIINRCRPESKLCNGKRNKSWSSEKEKTKVFYQMNKDN